MNDYLMKRECNNNLLQYCIMAKKNEKNYVWARRKMSEVNDVIIKNMGHVIEKYDCSLCKTCNCYCDFIELDLNFCQNCGENTCETCAQTYNLKSANCLECDDHACSYCVEYRFECRKCDSVLCTICLKKNHKKQYYNHHCDHNYIKMSKIT